MTSTLRTIVAASVVLCVGCGEERPTSPRAVAKLPPTPASSSLIAEHSEPLDGSVQSDSSRVIDCGSSRLFRSAGYSDVTVYCWGISVRDLVGPLQVYHARTGDWVSIRGALPDFLGACFGYCTGSANRIVSQIEETTPIEFLDSSGLVRVRAAGASIFSASLVQYTQDYHFSVSRVERIESALSIGIGVENNALYLFGGYLDLQNRQFHDSIMSLDLEGNRRWAIPIPVPPTGAKISTYGAGCFWVINHGDGELSQIDTSGQIVASASIPPYSADAMAWADGSLWYHDSRPASAYPVYRIDMDSTFATGAVVSTLLFSSGLPCSAIAVDSAGVLLAVGQGTYHEIHRFTFAGVPRDTIQLAVGGIRAISWDGESLWTLHHGPVWAHTDAILLTRFTLE